MIHPKLGFSQIDERDPFFFTRIQFLLKKNLWIDHIKIEFFIAVNKSYFNTNI